jgi:hypothetical protein
MAAIKKILGQINPQTAGTNVKLYSPSVEPRPKQATVESVFVTNRGATSTKFRVFIVPNGTSAGDNNIIYSDVTIAANDTFNATINITLGPGDSIFVYALASQLTFHAFGIEEDR